MYLLFYLFFSNIQFIFIKAWRTLLIDCYFIISVQFSNWDMIFYGTDTPAQPDDYVPKKPYKPLNVGGDLGDGEGEAGQHNSLDDEIYEGKSRDTKVKI